jgi:hypothetical protein
VGNNKGRVYAALCKLNKKIKNRMTNKTNKKKDC